MSSAAGRSGVAAFVKGLGVHNTEGDVKCKLGYTLVSGLPPGMEGEVHDRAVELDDIIVTELLSRRVGDVRDIAAENDALRRLMRDVPRVSDPLQLLVATAVDVCAAGSAGVSLLEPSADNTPQFRWVAMAGRFAGYVGGTTPGNFSPCGETLARGTPQLFSYPERFFTYFQQARPQIVEGLVIPFNIDEQSGTVWIVSHDERRWFTAGDAEFMSALAEFTATALSLQQSARREREARDRAEEANRLKDEFLATVCHELRTPLHAMVSWAELLDEVALPPHDVRDATAGLRRAVSRQSRLVEDLLDTSRIVSGHQALELTTTDFHGCVQSALEAVRPLAAAGEVMLQVSLGSGRPSVLGDAGRLEQAITNVLANATKFTPPGGHVQVESSRSANLLTLRISDTGIGIDAAFLPEVFERFRQADATTQRRYGGLGLGLTIARDIITGHGGTIVAESAGLGQGATFTITLPALAIQKAELATARPRAADRVRLTEVTILLVDDDADAREVIARILQRAGAIVRVATSAANALEILQGWSPDLLVSDIAMPDLDGFDLIARVRRQYASGQLKAAALSARTMPADRERALRAGFDAHLKKPLSASELVASLAAVLDPGIGRPTAHQ